MRPPQTRFLRLVTFVALAAVLFQVLAVDHWFADAGMHGDEFAQHESHCHGASGCADSGAPLPAVRDSLVDTLLPPEARLIPPSVEQNNLSAAVILIEDEPPRAA